MVGDVMSAHIYLHWATLAKLSTAQPIAERKASLAQRRSRLRAYRQRRLADYLKVDATQLQLVNTATGKPILRDYAHLSFNHSHSHQHYALAYSDRYANIGVDIEDLARQVRFEALAQHAFHPDEMARWQASDFDPIYWFKVWTTKEAVLKASGLGIRMNLNELNTQARIIEDGGMCQHAQIGSYAYQNIQLPSAMLTVAWSAEASCKGFNFPTLKIETSLTNEHIA